MVADKEILQWIVSQLAQIPNVMLRIDGRLSCILSYTAAGMMLPHGWDGL